MAKLRVLIVDDVPQVRQDLSVLLSLSCEIEIVGEAKNGQDAIRQVAALVPDVILMDLEMPQLDGYQATRQIKSQWPSCRVIALTVHSYAEARERASHAGVDVFIEKGAPIENLMQAIFDKEE